MWFKEVIEKSQQLFWILPITPILLKKTEELLKDLYLFYEDW